MCVVALPSIGISTEQFRSWNAHDNFVKTKTSFMLMEVLGRYFPGNKPVLVGSQSKFKHFDALVKSTMYEIGKEYLRRLKG